jgi:hypothetical protein
MYLRCIIVYVFSFYCVTNNFFNCCPISCAKIFNLFSYRKVQANAYDFGPENAAAANIKITFTYLKKNEIEEIKMRKYKYMFNSKKINLWLIGEKEQKQIIRQQDVNIQNINILDFINFEENTEDNKINIKTEDEWLEIKDFKKDLKTEEQEIVEKNDYEKIKDSKNKILQLDNYSPCQNGYYIIRIKQKNKGISYIFIDYHITIGRNYLYRYIIKNMIFKNEKTTTEKKKNVKIAKSNDGTNNEFTFELY